MNDVLTMEQIEFQAQADQQPIVQHIDIALRPQEFVALTGPSGSGKSTLLSMAGALLQPTSGALSINQTDVLRLNSQEKTKLRLQDIGFIFQSAHLLPYLKTADQLRYVGKLAGLTKQTMDQRIQRLLHMLGLEHRQHHFPRHLSGGEQQRVAIARAWMNDPSLILADEPTASLDRERGEQVVQTLRDQVKESNKAAIMVTHDTRLFAYCDRVIYLDNGQIDHKDASVVP
jgi:putative ABC transport system ATP-binding protein